MSAIFDITGRKNLHRLLLKLHPVAVPLWGNMKPQQMIEHLADQVGYTNGKKEPACDFPADVAFDNKQRMVYGDAEIPRNVILGTLPERYACKDIEAAINWLMQELEDFDAYFKAENATAIHGAAGPMNHPEWLRWHGKHFMHHLKQFGLIPSLP